MDFVKMLEEESGVKPRPAPLAKVLGVVFGGLAFVFTAASLPFLFPYFRRICLPYVPSTTQQVINVMEALKGRSGKFIDLGSGDGRIVLAAAKNGFESTGIELNPWLVLYSKIASFHMGLHKKTQFHRCNLWTYDLSPYNNVVIFGVQNMMNELERKFQKELPKGAQIIACRFPLPHFQPIKTVGVGRDKVWIYDC